MLDKPEPRPVARLLKAPDAQDVEMNFLITTGEQRQRVGLF